MNGCGRAPPNFAPRWTAMQGALWKLRERTGGLHPFPIRGLFPVKRLASFPSETPEDSIMSDVLPSIIVLAITALFVFRRELTTLRPEKGAPC
jgi:hypothetical protein